jgi:hypothetical protein
MIIPVQPRFAHAEAPAAFEGVSSRQAGTARWHEPAPRLTGETHRDDQTPIYIGSIIVESASPISTAALRDGFRDGWLRHEHASCDWHPDLFRRDLTIDLPANTTARELGRRLAEAILERARTR